MKSLARKAFLIVPALVLAAVLTIHPTDQADTIYESVSPVVDDWITVHVALLFAFPLLALATAMLVRGIEGRAATVARVSLVFFAVFYTAWEVMVGLTTGILTKYANGLPGAEQAGAAGAIEDLNGHWMTQVTLTLGSLGWIVADRGRRGRGARYRGRLAGCRPAGTVCDIRDPPAAGWPSRARRFRRRRAARRTCPLARACVEREKAAPNIDDRGAPGLLAQAGGPTSVGPPVPR